MSEKKLLIHSMAEFSSLTLPILEIINAKVVAEIGSEHGGNSNLLAAWLHARQGKLISIDPAPSAAFHQLIAQTGDVITHIPKLSLDAIADVKNADAWFIDGDHNWYTVYNELNALEAQAKNEERPLLIFLHDVAWPCARRDFYYAPDRIPAEFLLPHTWDLGTHVHSKELIKGGFRGEGQFATAIKEGGPRNGVLTAVEDFVALHPDDFYWALIPAVFGLGVLFHRNHPNAQAIAQVLAPLHENSLLAKLEENRLMNYLAVIEFQDRQRNPSPA
jgi:hypothetical protein